MYDPVFEVAYDRAKLHGFRSAPNPDSLRIAILQDVYSVAELHQRIPELCARYLRDARVNLICLEGADGVIPAHNPREGPRDIEREYPGLSTAARNVLLTRLPGVRFVGVDTSELHGKAIAARTALDQRQKAFGAYFSDEVRPLLEAAQEDHYPESFSKLRRESLALYRRSGMSLSDRVELVHELLRDGEASLEAFPQLKIISDAIASEHQLDFARIEACRNRLVELMIGRVGEMFGRGAVEEREENETLLRYCLEKFDIAGEELARSRELRGKETVNKELDHMLTTWLMRESVNFRKGLLNNAEYYSEFLGLADAMRIPAEETAPLRMYHDYVARVETNLVADAVMLQLDEVQQVLSRKLRGQYVAEIFDIEEVLESVYAALRCELLPIAAESLNLDPGSLNQSLDRLTSLTSWKMRLRSPARWIAFLRRLFRKKAAAGILVDGLCHAKAYCENNVRRGELMASKALAAMESQSAKRAIIIAGGFHSDTIRRTIDDETGYGWSVVRPDFTLPPDPTTPS